MTVRAEKIFPDGGRHPVDGDSRQCYPDFTPFAPRRGKGGPAKKVPGHVAWAGAAGGCFTLGNIFYDIAF